MTKARDNHNVPQWYQRCLLEPDREKLAYLHLNPEMHRQSDGSLKPGRTRFDSYTSQCFHKDDLYTTSYFGFDITYLRSANWQAGTGYRVWHDPPPL